MASLFTSLMSAKPLTSKHRRYEAALASVNEAAAGAIYEAVARDRSDAAVESTLTLSTSIIPVAVSSMGREIFVDHSCSHYASTLTRNNDFLFQTGDH